jgi:hypothetical protein
MRNGADSPVTGWKRPLCAGRLTGARRLPITSTGTRRTRTTCLAILENFYARLVEPRRALLRHALAAGDLPESADLDALTSMLIGSFYGRYVTIAGIPDDWPGCVLSAIWSHDASPASFGVPLTRAKCC